jgi:predicted NAD-dependent protein-ADP-ribosyltransferase YbiA (DUF1768 family)
LISYYHIDNNTTMSVDKLYFHSRSKDAEPGVGVNEFAKDENAYEELKKIKDWRKVLSNFHFCPFTYKGFTYNTIEHVYQSQMIGLVCPEKAYLFTLESGDEIGKGDARVARKNRKMVKLDKIMLAKWEGMIDDVQYEAALSKYNTCPEALKILRATGEAELWHLVCRSKTHIRFTHLERLRTHFNDIENKHITN